ncbi:rhodanese-like domain-containing protein [Iodobacter ciconiae]|nr:rhodanese-like domain-containing protein [Iodobacter ciconiae]
MGRIAGLGVLLGFVLALLAGSLAQAQELKTLKSGYELPDVLNAIPSAGGVCRQDDTFASLINGEFSKETTKLDLSCAKTAQDLVPILAQSKGSLIDLRSAADYRVWHVPNSTNLTLSDILTKLYLRNNIIVLMGDGRLESEIYLACSRLKHAGFRQVFMVRGGILGWMQHGYATRGNAVKLSDAVKITSAELWAGAQFVENRILLDADRISMRALLPSAIVLNVNAISMVRAIVSSSRGGKQKSTPLMGLIFVTSSTISEEQLRDLHQAALPYSLLVYTGTELDYRTFVDQQKAVFSAQARGPKTLGCGL